MKKRIIKYGGATTGVGEERAIIRSIKKSRKTGNWQEAEEGKLFTQECCDFLGVKYGVLTNSGSSAGLWLFLLWSFLEVARLLSLPLHSLLSLILLFNVVLFLSWWMLRLALTGFR